MGNLCNRPKEVKYSGDCSGLAGDMGATDSHHHGDSPAPPDYRQHIHSDAVTTVAAVRPGACVSGSKDKTVVLYDFDRGEVMERWVGHAKEVTQVRYARSSDRVFSSSRDMTIQVWSVACPQSQITFTGHSLVVTTIDLSPDETKLVSGSRDNTVRLWDVGTGQQIQHSCISRNLVNTVRWVPGSELVVQAGEDKEVRVFDTRSMDVAFSFPRKQYIQMCADVTPDGLYCLTCSNGFGGSGCEATLWDLRSHSLLTEFRGHTEAVESCAFLPLGDGNLFSTSGRDCCLKVWDLSTKECVSELSVSGAGPLSSIAPFTDGSICVGSFNSGIQLLSLTPDDGRTLRHKAQF